MAYSPHQWVLTFFFYGLCGWIWESCYVSIRQRRWVNRGFLHGPLLPIYGFGAVIILLATLRVQDSLWQVYLLGMASATALEYGTGVVMEVLFHVRYWDYSNQKFNLNGHICLTSSLAWGAFSLLLVRAVHPPISCLVLAVPPLLAEPLAFVLLAGTTVDTVQSFRAAMDLREILTRLTEENEDLRRLAKRAEVYSAFAEDDLRRFRERTEVEKLLLVSQWDAVRARFGNSRTDSALKRKEVVENRLACRKTVMLQALKAISDALESCRLRLEENRELTERVLAERKADIDEALERLRNNAAHIRTRNEKSFHQSLRILRSNPTLSAKQYAEAMDTLRKLDNLDN